MSTNRFRKKDNNFTVMSNFALDDKNLSPQAYYIYAKIQRWITMEYTKDKQGNLVPFNLTKEFLIKKSNMTQSTFEKYWKELQRLGYLKMYQMPDPENKGQFIYEYDILDKAEPTTPYLTRYNFKGKVTSTLRYDENKSSNKTVKKEPKKSSRQSLKTLKNQEVMEELTTPPKNHGVVKPLGGKTGGYNNNSDFKNSVENKNYKTTTTKEVVVVDHDGNQSTESLEVIKQEIQKTWSENYVIGELPLNVLEFLIKQMQHFEKDVVLELISASTRATKNPISYMERIAREYKKNKIVTFNDFVRYSEEQHLNRI